MKQPIRTKLLTILLPLLLAACGGGGGGAPSVAASATITNQPSADVFHGIAVPPDPGAAADATVAGIDTDHNGIRDEVDRALAQTYGADLKKYVAAQMIAKSSQKILLVNASDPVAAKVAIFESFDTAACLSDKLNADFNATSDIVDRNILLSYNTRVRQNQILKVQHAVGQFTRSMGDITCK